MGCCGSKSVDQGQMLTGSTRKRIPDGPTYKAHTIELSDYEYSYTYTDSDEGGV